MTERIRQPYSNPNRTSPRRLEYIFDCLHEGWNAQEIQQKLHDRYNETLIKGEKSEARAIQVLIASGAVEEIAKAKDPDNLYHGTDLWAKVKDIEERIRIQVKSSEHFKAHFKSQNKNYRKLHKKIAVINAGDEVTDEEIVEQFCTELLRINRIDMQRGLDHDKKT